MPDTNTKWDKHQMTEKVRSILDALPKGYPYNGYPGQPYLSAYQIAIEFKRRYPQDFQELGYLVGGKGNGPSYSLSVFIAERLASLIPDQIPDIEIAFLHSQDLSQVKFTGGIVASTAYLTVFRLR